MKKPKKAPVVSNERLEYSLAYWAAATRASRRSSLASATLMRSRSRSSCLGLIAFMAKPRSSRLSPDLARRPEGYRVDVGAAMDAAGWSKAECPKR